MWFECVYKRRKRSDSAQITAAKVTSIKKKSNTWKREVAMTVLYDVLCVKLMLLCKNLFMVMTGCNCG